MRATITRRRLESRSLRRRSVEARHGGQWLYTTTLEGDVTSSPFGAFPDGRPVLTRDDTSLAGTRSYLKRKGIAWLEAWSRQERIALTVAEAAVQRAFKGRKGHGGGPCTRRVLHPHQLHAILVAAIRIAIDIDHQKPAPAEEREQ